VTEETSGLELRHWIDDVLRKKNWTLFEWAERAGIGKTTLWRCVNGDSVGMHIRTVQKLVDASGEPFTLLPSRPVAPKLHKAG
jgi:hypothetical protein